MTGHVFNDLSEAFDTISHAGLLKKYINMKLYNYIYEIALIPTWILEKGFYYQGAKLLNEFPIRLNFENAI